MSAFPPYYSKIPQSRKTIKRKDSLLERPPMKLSELPFQKSWHKIRIVLEKSPNMAVARITREPPAFRGERTSTCVEIKIKFQNPKTYNTLPAASKILSYIFVVFTHGNILWYKVNRKYNCKT
jgi:hypothetical protein